MKPEPSGKESDFKTVATNRRATHDYFVLEKIEAGIVLLGCEVKSIRAGEVSLHEAYAEVAEGAAWIHNLHIQPYQHSRNETYEPARQRRLLLHKAEIFRLFGQTRVEGNTLIPLRVYLTRGKVKIELALARGKNTIDKRETLKRKTSEREVRRTIAARGRD